MGIEIYSELTVFHPNDEVCLMFLLLFFFSGDSREKSKLGVMWMYSAYLSELVYLGTLNLCGMLVKLNLICSRTCMMVCGVKSRQFFRVIMWII